MNTPLLIVGALLVVVVLVDVVWTTITAGGGRGPLSNAVARGLWRVGRVGAPGHRRREVLGVVVAAAVPALWVLLAWGGFTLVFLADDQAVVDAATQQPTSALGRVAFAAGGLAGAGASLVAGSPPWELVNNLSAIIGLALVTLSLTYLLQVVNAVTSERTVASQIAGLGPAPVEAVAHASTAPGLGTLPLQLSSIAESLSSAAQAHLAYPMLQFFHSQDLNSSVAVNLARFDDIITILDYGMPDDHTPTVRAGRSAVDRFLSTLQLPSEPAQPPPPPSLTALRRRCPDVVDDPGFAAAIAPLDTRRSKLHTYVREEGWEWRDVAAEHQAT